MNREILNEYHSPIQIIAKIENAEGIENLDKALEPFYTTKPDDERSGMGFTIMKSFMDDVKVVSKVGEGTKIYMTKKINAEIKGENA